MPGLEAGAEHECGAGQIWGRERVVGADDPHRPRERGEVLAQELGDVIALYPHRGRALDQRALSPRERGRETRQQEPARGRVVHVDAVRPNQPDQLGIEAATVDHHARAKLQLPLAHAGVEADLCRASERHLGDVRAHQRNAEPRRLGQQGPQQARVERIEGDPIGAILGEAAERRTLERIELCEPARLRRVEPAGTALVANVLPVERGLDPPTTHAASDRANGEPVGGCRIPSPLIVPAARPQRRARYAAAKFKLQRELLGQGCINLGGAVEGCNEPTPPCLGDGDGRVGRGLGRNVCRIGRAPAGSTCVQHCRGVLAVDANRARAHRGAHGDAAGVGAEQLHRDSVWCGGCAAHLAAQGLRCRVPLEVSDVAVLCVRPAPAVRKRADEAGDRQVLDMGEAGVRHPSIVSRRAGAGRRKSSRVCANCGAHTLC